MKEDVAWLLEDTRDGGWKPVSDDGHVKVLYGDACTAVPVYLCAAAVRQRGSVFGDAISPTCCIMLVSFK